MISLVLRIAAVVIFALLAFEVVIDAPDVWDWAFGASALFAASFLPYPAVGTFRRDDS